MEFDSLKKEPKADLKAGRWVDAGIYPQSINMGRKVISGNMSIVEIDERGRVTIPKEMRIEAEKALIIPMGETYMVVPIPKAPAEFDLKVSGKSAKEAAERRLSSDVKGRMDGRRDR